MSKRYGFRDIFIRKTKKAKILMITKDFGFFIVRRIGVTKPPVQLGVGKNTLV